MKKLIALTLAICIMLVLAGCNMALGLGNFEFKGIHVCDHSGNCCDLPLAKWHDNAEGIEVKTTNGDSFFCSEGTYILYENECPICSAKGE